jgi:hypothetical protein
LYFKGGVPTHQVRIRIKQTPINKRAITPIVLLKAYSDKQMTKPVAMPTKPPIKAAGTRKTRPSRGLRLLYSEYQKSNNIPILPPHAPRRIRSVVLSIVGRFMIL